MTITLDEDYFAVADEPVLGYCGETNSRTVGFDGLDNASADIYSLVLSYDDGVCYETRIENSSVTLTGSIMRRSGCVDAQVLACNMQGDEYTVVKKSNILQLIIKPSLDENAQPVPAEADCLRILGKIEQLASELTSLEELLVNDQIVLEQSQRQLTDAQQRLMYKFTLCLSQINESVEEARDCVEQISQSAEQIYINKSADGLEKKNLLKIKNESFDNGSVTVTADDDGVMTINGTTGELYVGVPLTSSSAFEDKKHIPNGRYILCTNGFSKYAVYVIGYKYEDGVLVQRSLASCNDGSDVEFVVDDEYDYNFVELWLDRNTTFTNEKVWVMIRYSGIADNSWEPYKPSLQEQINELGERIDSIMPYNETQTDTVSDSVEEVTQ